SALWTFFGLTPPESGELTAEAQIRTDPDWQQAGWVEADWRLAATDFSQAWLPAALTGTVAAKSRLDRNGLAILGLVAETGGGLAADWRSRLEGELSLRDDGAGPALDARLSLAAGGPSLSLAPFGAGDV